MKNDLRDRCIALAEQGMSGADITRELNISRYTVYSWMHKAGIYCGDNFYVSDQEKDTIIEMRESGLSYKEIADALKIGLNRVKGICKANKIKISDEAKNAILERSRAKISESQKEDIK